MLTHILLQWWDAVQQTNRPHGWAFNDITNGVIRDMKLWKVCATMVVGCRIRRDKLNCLAHCLELLNQRLEERPRV